MLRWVALALFVPLCASTEEVKDAEQPAQYDRGWGPTIRWVANYTQGLEIMVKSQKPLMVIHHLDTCPFSQALKKVFAADKSIQKLAREGFIMLNVQEETPDPNMAADGYYVPRILFVDPSKTVRTDIRGNYDTRFYTYTPEDIRLLFENMKKATMPHHNEL